MARIARQSRVEHLRDVPVVRGESVNTATLCQGALLRSVTSGIAVYDTLFVELAARTGCPLLTFDKAVIKAFPDIAIRPRDLPES